MRTRSSRFLPLILVAIAPSAFAADAKLDLSTASREEMTAAFPKMNSTVFDRVLELRQEKGPCKDVVDLAASMPESSLGMAVMIGKGAYCSGKSPTASTAGSGASNAGSRTSGSSASARSSSGSPAASPADAGYADYAKLNSPAGWVEFLSAGPSADYAAKGQKALAAALGKDPKSTVTLGQMTSVECKGGSLTQSEMVDNMDVIGSKWKYYCEKGSFTYTISNPTTATVFVRGKAYGVPIDALIAPGKSASATATMASACSSGEHKFSAGRVTFGCRAEMSLQSAGVITTELAAYPDLLRTSDPAMLRRFLAEFPDSYLVAYAKERLAAADAASLEALRKQLKTSITLGPAPAKLIDPRPYTLTIENPAEQALVVTVMSKSYNLPAGGGSCPPGTNVAGARCTDVKVDANGSATLSMQTAPSADPEFTLLQVVPQDP